MGVGEVYFVTLPRLEARDFWWGFRGVRNRGLREVWAPILTGDLDAAGKDCLRDL